mmetsp:Transcript_17553/g.25614  ORF Transcript_17553/g.25614 Transcript_17553/m.25614 type:complete len:431 (+) Transcript_17553:605-1897(+)
MRVRAGRPPLHLGATGRRGGIRQALRSPRFHLPVVQRLQRGREPQAQVPGDPHHPERGESGHAGLRPLPPPVEPGPGAHEHARVGPGPGLPGQRPHRGPPVLHVRHGRGRPGRVPDQHPGLPGQRPRLLGRADRPDHGGQLAAVRGRGRHGEEAGGVRHPVAAAGRGAAGRAGHVHRPARVPPGGGGRHEPRVGVPRGGGGPGGHLRVQRPRRAPVLRGLPQQPGVLHLGWGRRAAGAVRRVRLGVVRRVAAGVEPERLQPGLPHGREGERRSAVHGVGGDHARRHGVGGLLRAVLQRGGAGRDGVAHPERAPRGHHVAGRPPRRAPGVHCDGREGRRRAAVEPEEQGDAAAVHRAPEGGQQGDCGRATAQAGAQRWVGLCRAHLRHPEGAPHRGAHGPGRGFSGLVAAGGLRAGIGDLRRSGPHILLGL